MADIPGALEDKKFTRCLWFGGISAAVLGFILGSGTLAPYCMLPPANFLSTIIHRPWTCIPGAWLMIASIITAPVFLFVQWGSYMLEEPRGRLWDAAKNRQLWLPIYLVAVGPVIWGFNQHLPTTGNETLTEEFVSGIFKFFAAIPFVSGAVFAWLVIWLGSIAYIVISAERAYAYWTTVHPLEPHVDGKLKSGSSDIDGSRVAANLGARPSSEEHGLGLRRRAQRMKDEAERALRDLQTEEKNLAASIKTTLELQQDEAELSEKLREVERLKARIDEQKKQLRDL